MKNKQNLRECGLVLIFLGIVHLFIFLATFVESLVDGTVAEAFANVDPSILTAVKVVTGIFVALVGLIVVADVFIGIKALKVSKNNSADKGHITASKVFFVLSVIAAISAVVSLIDGSASIIDGIINLAESTLGACIYLYVVKIGNAFRQEVLHSAE